jgi:hypothetical protein
MTMRLTAETYHTRLDDGQREIVNRWMASALGDDWQKQLISAYEVVGEGQVRIERLGPPGTTIECVSSRPPVPLEMRHR